MRTAILVSTTLMLIAGCRSAPKHEAPLTGEAIDALVNDALEKHYQQHIREAMLEAGTPRANILTIHVENETGMLRLGKRGLGKDSLYRAVANGIGNYEHTRAINRKFVDVGLAEARRTGASVDPADRASLMLPRVREAFRTAMENNNTKVHYLAWAVLNSVEMERGGEQFRMYLYLVNIQNGEEKSTESRYDIRL